MNQKCNFDCIIDGSYVQGLKIMMTIVSVIILQIFMIISSYIELTILYSRYGFTRVEVEQNQNESRNCNMVGYLYNLCKLSQGTNDP